MCADRMKQLPMIPERSATMPPVAVLRPMTQAAPVVFVSAHSGRQYSADFVAASRLQLHALRRSEDSFVEELYQAAPGLGAPMVVANFPRAYCDANREKWELDPAMFTAPLPDWVNTTSARVGAGLGTVARIVASGETIYRGKLDFAEVQARIAGFWQPFHDALKAEISATSARFGHCLLVDCHSMPGTSQGRLERVDIILGDIHGTSCAPRIVRNIEERLNSLGFRVRRNDPYAGGYITRHYGRPREGVHAVQIEICRTLYMDEPRLERLAGFDAVQARISRLVRDIIEENGFFSDI
jgi:N-formylglutamate deformylase